MRSGADTVIAPSTGRMRRYMFLMRLRVSSTVIPSTTMVVVDVALAVAAEVVIGVEVATAEGVSRVVATGEGACRCRAVVTAEDASMVGAVGEGARGVRMDSFKH